MHHLKHAVKPLVAGLLLLTLANTFAQEASRTFPTLKTKNGTTYVDVTIKARTPTELKISHKSGLAVLRWDDLSPETQTLFGYAPPIASESPPGGGTATGGKMETPLGTAPQNPMIISTHIGEAVTGVGKVTVSLQASVASQGVSSTVTIKEDRFFGGSFTLSGNDIRQLATLVQDASQSSPTGNMYAGRSRAADVNVGIVNGRAQVSITFFASKRSIQVDLDNAATFAKLLMRASDVVTWLTPRLEVLRPN